MPRDPDAREAVVRGEDLLDAAGDDADAAGRSARPSICGRVSTAPEARTTRRARIVVEVAWVAARGWVVRVKPSAADPEAPVTVALTMRAS